MGNDEFPLFIIFVAAASQTEIGEEPVYFTLTCLLGLGSTDLSQVQYASYLRLLTCIKLTLTRIMHRWTAALQSSDSCCDLRTTATP